MTSPVAPLPPLRRILAAALLVALLDGLAAVTFYAWILHVTTPTRIFQGILLFFLLACDVFIFYRLRRGGGH